MIDRRFEPHDRNQLELKLGYAIDPEKRSQRFHVETYFFLSRILGVSGATYTADHFFADVASFVRLRTPTVALAALARDVVEDGYFTRVRTRIDTFLGGTRADPGDVIKHLKILGCIYKSALRDEGNLILERFDDAAADTDPADSDAARARQRELAVQVDGFTTDLAGALARLHTMGRNIEHSAVPQGVRDVWVAVDEYVSLVAEGVLTQIVASIDAMAEACDDGVEPSLQVSRERLADAAIEAYRYRRGRNYPSYAMEQEDNEALPYRRRVLKRLISSVLYLDIQHAHPGELTRDVIGMAAAAVAMLFAVVVAIWAQETWSMFSGAFIGVMVVSYIIKDRIKEWGKRYVGGRLMRTSPDRVVHVKDADGNTTFGRCRERFAIVDAQDVDPEIIKLRHEDHPTQAAEDGRPEVVLCYEQFMRLSSRSLERELDGIDGLNDIIRFNVNHLRQRMDDPDEAYLYVDPDTRELSEAHCSRVYHMNIVLRITSGRGKSRRVETEHLRAVIDQKGIRRIE